MRLREQILVIAAVAAATIALAANVYGFSRVQEMRADLSQTPMSFAPVPMPLAEDPILPEETVDGDGTSTEAHDPRLRSVDHLRETEAPGNHGANVSALATRLRYVEGLDGPPGALVRTIARANPQANDPPPWAHAEGRDHGKPAESPGRSRDR